MRKTLKQTSKFAIFLAFLMLATGIRAQSDATKVLASNEEKETTISKTLKRKFLRDAARLALRMEAKMEELRYQNITIPRDNVENIYKVLTDIYLKDEKAQAIARCKIHTFPNPSIDHFVIVFNKDIDWAEPLQMGINETTSEEFNDLLEEYDLIIEKHVQWSDTQDAITIRSKEPLNMAALANEFYNIDGIVEIDLGIPKIGGNDINIKRIENGWEVEYILRFGSYISGKGKMHIWKYEALDNGSIKFINESGDPIPAWMKCDNKLEYDKKKLAFRS